MPPALKANRRGVLACAALLLAALAATFPVLPAYATSSAALKLLEHSRARHRALDGKAPGCPTPSAEL